MKMHDGLLGAIFAALGLAVIVQSFGFTIPRHLQFGPGLFPRLMGAGMLVCALGLMAGSVRQKLPLIARPEWFSDRRLTLNVVLIPAACVFYYLASTAVGFQVAALVILVGLFMVNGVRPLQAILVGLAITAATTIVFASILHVPLPWGLLTPVSGYLIW